MKAHLMFISILLSLSLHAQEVVWQGASVDFKHGKLKVSDNKRFLVFEDGTPFFYLACTGWELFHRLDIKEAETYLENRRSKGFTVIQAVALAELDGLNTPNANGDKPFDGDNDLNRPNEKYWKHVDAIIRLAAQKGIFIALLPTWGDKVDKRWGTGPVVFTPETAAKYGTWIGSRYKNEPNIIWVNGGDRPCGMGNEPVWNALGTSIKAADPNHLMTFHPWGTTSSSECFHDAGWLDFNMLQSGHSDRYLPNYSAVHADYCRTPVKPCMDGEPCYEDHPIRWNGENGWFDDWDVRRTAYQAVFAGAHGHTYGCHPIWQMKHPQHDPIGGARHNWNEVLDLPGAWDMIHLRKLLESHDMLSRLPDQSILLSEQGGKTNYIAACRGKGYAFVYLPANDMVQVRLNKIQAQKVNASWHNPRTGQSKPIGEYDGSLDQMFQVPVQGVDWVLVLEDAAIYPKQ